MKKILPLLWFILCLAACAPAPAWDAATLRALDPGDAPAPAADITALYTRQRGIFTEIRLDLLDIPFDPALDDSQQPPLPDIYIALDTQPGGFIAWAYPKSQTAIFNQSDLEYDILVAIPGRGSPAVYAAMESGLREEGWRLPAVSVERTTDTITLRYLSPGLPIGTRLQAITLDNIQVDQTPVIGAADQASDSVRLLLLFYDVFPSTTPAQALRRWDGAHTGPYGERHGLKHLLLAAERTNLPITLLDLALPERLAALDYVGGIKILDNLMRQNLVSLGLSTTEIAWPAPDENDLLQPTAQGLSLDARRALVNAALGGQPLVWGGELAYSAWANADAAAPSMAYLAARPYVRVLPSSQFMGAAQPGPWEPLTVPSGLDAPDTAARVAQMPPDSPITQLAQRMLSMLTAPTRDPRLRQLRAQYLPDLDALSHAVDWGQSPRSLSMCEQVQGYCFLGSERFFAILRSDGARLVYLFMKDKTGIHQIVGPTYQFETGLSDRSIWALDQGQGADPGALGGAFVDADAPWAVYTASVAVDGSILFTRDDNSRLKTFLLTENGLRAGYAGDTPAATKIGLVLDPWRRFEPNWGGLYGLSGAGGWGVQSGPSVSIQAAGDVIRATFLDSREKMGMVEDPNFEYPPGHFLPFPMAVFTVNPGGDVILVVR